MARLSKILRTFRSDRGHLTPQDHTIGGRVVTLVDETNDAGPRSIAGALSRFRSQFPDRRRVLVLGAIPGLVSPEADLHPELLDPVLASEPAAVYLLGSSMTPLWSRLPDELRGVHAMSTGQLRPVLRADLQDGDVVLLTGSRESGLHQLTRSLGTKARPGDVESWRVTISGPAVQRVGYRRSIQRQALAASVDGWIRNRSDGKVEALLRGQVSDLDRVYGLLHTGPAKADVTRVVAKKVTTVPRAGFRIRSERAI